MSGITCTQQTFEAFRKEKKDYQRDTDTELTNDGFLQRLFVAVKKTPLNEIEKIAASKTAKSTRADKSAGN